MTIKDPSTITAEVSLEPIKHAVEIQISTKQLKNLNYVVELDHYLDYIIVKLEKEVYSERLKDETVRWPATWWDAFKLEWFPLWLIRQYPVKYNNADFTIYRGYPDLVLPDKKSVLFSMRKYA